MTETLTPQREAQPPAPPPSETKTPRGPVTVADVLERAADLLGEYGWCQGAYYTCVQGHRYCDEHELSSLCAEGALYHAADDLGWRGVISPGGAGDHVPVWNDAPGRTKAEVISALRAAASSARTKEEA